MTQTKLSRYHVHPTVAYARAIVENMPEKTGKSITEWAALAAGSGLDNEKERRAWLKQKFGLGGTTITLIVNHAAGRGEEDIDPERYLASAPLLVDAMYAGPKAHLRPIYDHLLEIARGLGPDLRVSPCKTIVPLYRTHVFAELKPTTQKRVDLGLALKAYAGPMSQRVLETGGLAKGDRITHRIPITDVAEIDDEVRIWLERAYDLDA